MGSPHFSKQTIDTLAKRARYQCSNPDCGAQTVGPNSNPEQATLRGEAAHIAGAKLGTARYDPAMSDVTSSAITNGIWLCRNCHVQIDRDAQTYPTELLFAWRREHEKRAALELGTRGDRIRYETEVSQLDFLAVYPALIQRIVIERPEGWEWRSSCDISISLRSSVSKTSRRGTSTCPRRPVWNGTSSSTGLASALRS